MSTSSERPMSALRPEAPRAGRGVAGRRRGAGKRFLVVGDVLDGTLVETAADATRTEDPAAVIRHRPVGAAGTTAAWLGWLGATVDLVGRVGVDDVYRHERSLADSGVRAHFRWEACTGTGALVSVRNGDARTVMTDPGASAAVGPDDIPVELVDGADLVHLTGAALLGGGGADRIAALVGRARSASTRVSLDPSSAAVVSAVGQEAFLAAIAGVDVLFPNEQEAVALTGAATVSDAVRMLVRHVPLVVVTTGADGAFLGRPGRSPQRIPPAPAAGDDTFGVGDAFAAGFLRAWATDPVRVGAAAREGARVAARALGVVGGRPSV